VSNASCFNDLEVKSVKNCQVRSAFASWTSESVTMPRVLMIWKSKVWKTVSSAPLLSVQLRKSVKTPRVLTIWKWWKKTRMLGPLLDVPASFFRGRRNGFCTWSKVS
jgi:hypothetical protein